MPRPLVIDTIVDLSPLVPKIGATDTVPAALEPAILGNYGAADEQTRLFAVIDAAQVPGLTDILESQELDHRCLYAGSALEEHGDLAPWLVELRPDDRMLRNLMTAAPTPQEDGPWHFWRRQVGIFLRSDQPLDVLWSHFRKYTKLHDVHGDVFFLRFFEPDFLAAMMAQAEPGEVAGFFAPLHSVVAIEQRHPETFAANILSAHPDLDAAPTRMVLTRRKWRAMQLVEYNRRARQICVAHDIPKAEHQAFVDTAVRLQTHGFDHERNLLDTFDVLKQVDPGHHPSIWQMIASGAHSMGFILFKAREHFGLERNAS